MQVRLFVCEGFAMNKKVPRGRFVWYELLTTDTGAAQRFYTQLIGWDTASWRTDEQPYMLWMNRQQQVGGLMELPEQAAGAEPHWLGYVSTPDCDASVALAANLGARTLMPCMDVPQVGRIAVLADPQGAVIGVFTPNEEHGDEDREPAVGEVSWHELVTTDHAAALSFYEALFGWKKTESMDMGDAGLYQMYGRNGRTLGGMFNKSPGMPGPAWLYYVRVEDVDAATAKIPKLGGRVVVGPLDVPDGGRIVQCLDPQGAMFALHSRKDAAKT
jgi:predicted enzyme related to lactoylglutathione lyase